MSEQHVNREAIHKAVAPILVNASRYPRKVQPYILGQDMSPLIASVVDAVMARLEGTT